MSGFPFRHVLITGGAGFLGSHVVDRAMKEGCRVVVMDNLYTGRLENLHHHVGNPRFSFVRHDVTTPYPPEVTMKNFDAIFHLACAASPVHYQADPIGTTMTCVNGTYNSLMTALRCDCPVMIASTSEVYGNPDVHPQPETYHGNVSCTGVRACYDEGKRCAEALAFDFYRKHGCKIRVARIFNTYGPRMLFNDGRIVSNFVVQALRGDDITVYGTGEATRSFQFCDDLVEGFFRLVAHPTETGPVNLGNPVEFTVKETAQMIKDMVPGTKSKIIHLPALPDDPQQRRPDISKAKAVLGGWEPRVHVAEGLAKTKIDFESRLARDEATHDRIYVQCNPLLDISSHVDADFLAKYSLQQASAALCTDEQQPIYAELEARADVKYIPGGSGLNTARVAQWMAQAPKKSLVSYVGCIADDKYGHILKSSAEFDGVNMALQFTEKAPTGSCAVCVVGKERSLLANLAAANNLAVDHLQTEPVQAALVGSRLFYLTGFTLTISPEHALFVARHSRKVGGSFAMNLSAEFILQFFLDQFKQVLPLVDIIFANDDEARAFSKAMSFGTDDVVEIARCASALPSAPGARRGRLVVITQGAKPSVWATPEAAGEVAVPLIHADQIIDTNGAGDAFVGGYLAAAAKGAGVEKSIEAGHYAAGVIIRHDGCTFPAVPEMAL